MAGVRVALLLLAVCACASTALGKQQFGEWLQQSPTEAKASSHYEPARHESVCLKEVRDVNCRCANGFWYYYDGDYYDYCEDSYWEMEVTCCDASSDGGLLTNYVVGRCEWVNDWLLTEDFPPVSGQSGVYKLGTFHVTCQLNQGAEKCGEACTDKMILTGTGSMYEVDQNVYVDSLPDIPNPDNSCDYGFFDAFPTYIHDGWSFPRAGGAPDGGRNHTHNKPPGQKKRGPKAPRDPANSNKHRRGGGRSRRGKAPKLAKAASYAPEHAYDVSVKMPRMGYVTAGIQVFAGTFTVTNVAKTKKYDQGLLSYVFAYGETPGTLVAVPDMSYLATPYTAHLKFIESGEY